MTLVNAFEARWEVFHRLVLRMGLAAVFSYRTAVMHLRLAGPGNDAGPSSVRHARVHNGPESHHP